VYKPPSQLATAALLLLSSSLASKPHVANGRHGLATSVALIAGQCALAGSNTWFIRPKMVSRGLNRGQDQDA
jgi:hypothetical protein